MASFPCVLPNALSFRPIDRVEIFDYSVNTCMECPIDALTEGGHLVLFAGQTCRRNAHI